MINLFDILCILAAVLSTVVGYRRGLYKQLPVAAGVVSALFVAAVLYHKLAFLTGRSSLRVVILLLLTIAAGLLFYDVLLAVGRWLGVRVRLRLRMPVYVSRVGGGITALVTVGIVVWVATAMLESSMPLSIRRVIQESRFAQTMQDTDTAPQLFTRVSYLLDPFRAPRVFAGVEPTFTGSPEATLTQEYSNLDAIAAKAATSVVKIEAWGCGTTAIGTGFVAADRTIITNAHVVAGATRLSVHDKTGTHMAQAAWFDPDLDVAVLTTSEGVGGKALSFREKPLAAGALGIFLGYGGTGKVTAGDAVILEMLNAKGYDIYGRHQLTRTIYAFRSTVVPGDSGGPLLAADGAVAGLVFGHSTAQNKTGYAITAGQIAPVLKKALTADESVSTGSCGS